jgi:hypothetical protein
VVAWYFLFGVIVFAVPLWLLFVMLGLIMRCWGSLAVLADVPLMPVGVSVFVTIGVWALHLFGRQSLFRRLMDGLWPSVPRELSIWIEACGREFKTKLFLAFLLLAAFLPAIGVAAIGAKGLANLVPMIAVAGLSDMPAWAIAVETGLLLLLLLHPAILGVVAWCRRKR